MILLRPAGLSPMPWMMGKDFLMSGIAYLGLLAALGCVLTVLSWVGWRFFVAPVPVRPAEQAGRREAARGAWWKAGVSGVVFGALSQLSRKYLSFVAVVLMVGGLGVGCVFSLSEWISPDPLAALEMDRQAHIQAKLNPEFLVPPPTLPPSMFMGSERLALETADRDWGKLDPVFTQRVLSVLSRLNEKGYSFALLEGYRSPERQEKLADLGSNVTNARAFQSKHQFGRAVDLAPISGGRLIISEKDPWAMKAYEALGEEAEKSGLTWGGRWWFKDFGHIESAESIRAGTHVGK